MPLEPIAIIGRGCVLPGCLTPDALWEAVVTKRLLVTPPPLGAWGLSDQDQRAGASVGGFVTGFDEVFDPDRPELKALNAHRLDPVVTWLLHAGGEAWREANSPKARADRVAVIVGNLSYPTRGLSDFAADTWLGRTGSHDPRNRFNSGYPAFLLARGLGAEGTAFALDAACASSLYAIKLACDQLRDRTADVVVAGAVNAADSLLINRGFQALQALSPTGRTRPFVEGADGLVPAEGAAAVVLKRASDIESGERVFGLIRAVGVSNDGARRGLLMPDQAGQIEAMLNAYRQAQLDPGTISLIECHATGTPLGDSTELKATDEVFTRLDVGKRIKSLPVGSLKSNIGHLITVAGLGSLLKLVSAMEHKTLPPMLMDGEPNSAFAGLTLHPQTDAEPWLTRRPRRAGISNFGFGGNNAHLILEEYRKSKSQPAIRRRKAPAKTLHERTPASVVICGIGLNAGPDRGVAAVTRRLLHGRGNPAGPATEVTGNPRTARIPPLDMARAQPLQLAVLDVAAEALSRVTRPDMNRIGCFVGMGCDPDAARLMLSERFSELLGPSISSDKIAALRSRIAAPISSADSLGAMPNMPANRLNTAYDWRGMGFTVSAEEHSGLVALNLAGRAVRSGQLDMALVAAADFSADPVHEAALAELGIEILSGDGAAALVIKRMKDVKRDGEAVIAVLDDSSFSANCSSTHRDGLGLPEAIYGRAHAASGLMEVAVTAMLGEQRLRVIDEAPAPWLTNDRMPVLEVQTKSFTGIHAKQCLSFPTPPRPVPDAVRSPPLMEWYAASDKAKLITSLDRIGLGGGGICRLVLIAYTPEDMAAKRVTARNALACGDLPVDNGVFFGEGQAEGELAFVFTGAAAAYTRMGMGLLSAFPEVGETLAAQHDVAAEIAPLMATPLDIPFDQLRTMTLLCQAHVTLLRDILGIEPQASIGLSAGETNAMVAFRAWRDTGALLSEMEKTGAYQRYIGGNFEALNPLWGDGSATGGWTNWLLLAPVEDVKGEVAKYSRVDITIIYDDNQCLIGGAPEECARVICAFGPDQAIRSNQDLIVHTPMMTAFEDAWRKLHTRRTWPVKGVRFYTNAGNGPFELNRNSAADALTGQAVSQIDFPKTIRRAYADGVRSFVEIGPRNMLTRSIETILSGEPHLAVAADRIDRADMDQIVALGAELFTAGHNVKMDVLAERLRTMARTRLQQRRPEATDIAFPAHRSLPEIKPETSPEPATMPVAPGRPVLATRPNPVSTALQTSTPAKTAFRPQLVVPDERSPCGPCFDQPALEAATTGPISALFGPQFQQQGGYERVVRMPTPPLLLTQRVTGIDAKPGILGKGTIWTESDVGPDAWYMHAERMRPGPLIEAGQADLLLISYMGIDFLNKGDRIYRLLGCELTFHPGGSPRSGDTLRYDIRINGHAEMGGVRMFFFEYDCRIGDRLLLSVRNGQAGFFKNEELAASKGVLWDPSVSGPPTMTARPFDTSRASAKRTFSVEDIEAFRAGDAFACFGEGFERSAAHSFPAVIPGGKLALFDNVETFDPEGGPWRRGYIRTRHHVSQDAWFYKGHFHNDPCMPGTLMAEAAVQALEFYAAAVGLTLERDAYGFEPMEGAAAKFLCRGQVIPDAGHDLIYEIFIDEIVEGESPLLFASLLASSDGLKVFQCERFGVTLRRIWPNQQAVEPDSDWRIEGPAEDVRGDQFALLECATGKPSGAFGKLFANFDNEGQSPRLPKVPYHAISRVLSISEAPGLRKIGTEVVTEYDPPDSAWYFKDNGNGAMPFAFLLELALQPCGWLASFSGFALSGRTFFRNLDGEGKLKHEIRPCEGPIRVEATLTRFSTFGEMTIVFFDVKVSLAGGGDEVFNFTTNFGFFPQAALSNQAGHKASDTERAFIARAPEKVPQPGKGAALPSGQMRMIDRLDYYDAEGGSAGLGLARGSQVIDPYAWYFKAHFFQDPVQPGSLGLDALIQVLETLVKLKGLDKGFAAPLFEALSTHRNIKWSYRGQVTPERKHVATLIEITAIEEGDEGITVTADGSLWADGLKIYTATGLSVSLVER